MDAPAPNYNSSFDFSGPATSLRTTGEAFFNFYEHKPLQYYHRVRVEWVKCEYLLLKVVIQVFSGCNSSP